MTEAEAIILLLKVAREWLQCNPSRGNGESGVSSERVKHAVWLIELPDELKPFGCRADHANRNPKGWCKGWHAYLKEIGQPHCPECKEHLMSKEEYVLWAAAQDPPLSAL